MLYKSGQTFQAIGNSFGFTRQRTQQIVFKEIEKEIAEKKGLNYKIEIKNNAKNPFAHEAHKVINDILKNKGKADFEKQKKLLRSKMKLLPHYSTFFSFKDYSAAAKIDPKMIRFYFPDIALKLAGKRGKKDPKVMRKIKEFTHYSKFSSMNKYEAAIGIDRRTIRKYCPSIAKKFFKKWSNSALAARCRICGKKLSGYSAKTCQFCLNEKIKNEIIDQMKFLPSYSTFPNYHSYCVAISRTADTMEKYFPHIAKELINKKRKKQ